MPVEGPTRSTMATLTGDHTTESANDVGRRSKTRGLQRHRGPLGSLDGQTHLDHLNLALRPLRDEPEAERAGGPDVMLTLSGETCLPIKWVIVPGEAGQDTDRAVTGGLA
ncbi:MAG: hypothetical protein RL238_3617 [Actinomycetota bacterium]|jgi:hypothetical protein